MLHHARRPEGGVNPHLNTACASGNDEVEHSRPCDQSRLKSAQIALEKVREELRVLEEYTKQRTIKDLESKLAGQVPDLLCREML